MKDVVPELLLEMLGLLTESNIDFVVVGGVALRIHGGAHITEDLDISFALDDDNCRRLVEVLNQRNPRPLAFPHGTQFVLTEGLLQRARFVNLKTDRGDIDLLPLPSGIDSYEALKNRSETFDLGEFSVGVASLDDLIAMKTAANRPKDQRHLMELAALKRLRAEMDAEMDAEMESELEG